MFAFSPYLSRHACCANPFGATYVNPNINFALGVAAATALPAYHSTLPIFGFGYNYYSPLANYARFLSYTIPTYYNYNVYPYGDPLANALNKYYLEKLYPTNNSNNPFLNYQTTPSYQAPSQPSSTWTTPSSSSRSSSSSSSSSESSAAEDSTAIATSGITLNRRGNGYGPEFLAKVKQIAKRLNCNYRDLLGLMNSESGIRTDAKNPKGSATGLIQFIESTANELGTTTAELRRMSPIEQLDYVERYLAKAKANAGITGKLTAGDLYALTFLPGRANRQVITTIGEVYYAKNTGLDLNHDGRITKNELGQRIRNKYVSDNSFLA